MALPYPVVRGLAGYKGQGRVARARQSVAVGCDARHQRGLLLCIRPEERCCLHCASLSALH